MGQDRLSHLSLLCIEQVHVNRVDIEKKKIDGFSSKKGRSKFFLQLIFKPKNVVF